MFKRVVYLIAVSILLFIPVLNQAQSQEAIKAGNITVEPGNKKSGYVNVSIGTKGPEVEIPITIINGNNNGPVITVSASVEKQGDIPVMAVKQLRNELQPEMLSGAVILVEIVRSRSFLRRNIYQNPYEGMNLKRVYPGRTSGSSIGARIAYQIMQEIVEESDFLIEMHSPEAGLGHLSYIYCTDVGNPFLVRKTKEMTGVFGTDIIVNSVFFPANNNESVYLCNTALFIGKPSILVFSGNSGEIDENPESRTVKGIYNVFRQTGLIEGETEPVKEQIWIRQIVKEEAKHNGLFFPAVQIGQNIQKGETAGYIRDEKNEVLQEIMSPKDGIILSISDKIDVSAGMKIVVFGINDKK